MKTITDTQLLQKILRFQKNEITEYHIYSKLSSVVRGKENKNILQSIANDENRHYGVWKKYSQQDVKPDSFKVLKYYVISRMFGVTFGIKLMELGEKGAQESYTDVSKLVPEAEGIAKEENGHERELIELIDEEKLKYVGSIVLGLNDALVEFTGALAGFTFAMRNSRLVATAGFITGIAASLSMAASEYLSTKSEGRDKSPLKAAIYTGVAYVLTVSLLVAPFILLNHLYLSLSLTMANAIIVIWIFTYYISIVKGLSFKKRFIEMACISLGVATLSFFIGLLIR
jgi:vacuolar iron transporter family protein